MVDTITLKIEGVKIAVGVKGKAELSGYFHAQGEDEERNLIYQVTDDNLRREVGSILVAVT